MIDTRLWLAAFHLHRKKMRIRETPRNGHAYQPHEEPDRPQDVR